MKLFLTLILFGSILSGCASQRRPIPAGEIPKPPPVTSEQEQYGHEVLTELTQEYPLSNNDAEINRVRELVDRLAVAAGAGGEPWHTFVLEGDDVRNAAATKGNHVFVWTGLIKAVRGDEELVTVLAHEMGHVLANHPTLTPDEETTMVIPGVAGSVTRTVISSQGSIGLVAELAQILVEQTLTAALVNPESQRKELEADIIGLHLMAQAGFNPEAAISFWDRIKDIPYFSSGTLGFLSSHPSSEARLENLRSNLPQALARFHGDPAYNSATGSSSTPALTSITPTSDEFWIVEEQNVPIHSAPFPDSPVISRLRLGDVVRVIDRDRRWLKISEPKAGWTLGRNLSPKRGS